MTARIPFTISALLAVSLAACGGGGSSAGTGAPGPVPIATATPTSTPVSTQQVVTMALPSSAMGSLVDPAFGLIGGYTQGLYSQSLAFAPGSQIMVRNGQAAAIPHTLSVVSTTGFTAGATLSTTAAGGSTIGSGFSSGTLNSGALAGPFTLAAGSYWLGCAYHYASNAMRTVLVVAANATPGPQATPPAPTETAPPAGNGY